MAGRGPAPKNPDERRRRNAELPTTVVSSDGQLHGPELPDLCDWHQATSAWWETWRRSAQAVAFTDTDWSFLLDTALMHHAMWSKGQWTLAAEVRLRVAKFGATPEDRARLRIEIGEPVRPAPSRSQPKGRRERLLKAVGEGVD